MTKRATVYKAVLAVFEFIFPASYFYLTFQSNHFNFLLRCLDVILTITLISIIPNDWINACAAAFFSYFNDLNKRRQYLNRMLLKQLVETDYLTGVNSRVKFDEACRQLLAISNHDNTPMCMAVFDIDDFKKINDTHGHIVGDKVLISLSSLVTQNLKGEEFFARCGGEEFVLIFPSSNLEQSVDRINDLREKINAFVFTDGIYLSCSFGVVSALGIDDLDTLIDEADRLMYLAKLAGKDIVVYDQTLI
jgi:two-component system cell cycle response regulator